MPPRPPVLDSRNPEISLCAPTPPPPDSGPPFWQQPFRRLRDDLSHLLTLTILGVGALGAVTVARWLEDRGIEHWVALVIHGLAGLTFVGQAILTLKHVVIDFIRGWKEQ